MAKRYLLFQLGEFGVMCPVTCTEGLVALIKQFPEDHTPEVEAILKQGPRNVRLMQLFRDIGRAAEFYPADVFLADLFSGASETEVTGLSRRAMEFAADPPFQKLDEGSRRGAVAWEPFVVDIFRIYQETALREVGPEPEIGSDKMNMPGIWR